MNNKSSAGEQNLESLNEYHQLRVRVFFQHIDSLLTEVEEILAEAQSGSPFSRYIADTTPIQQRVAHDYAVRIRTAMARIMKEQGISFGEPRCGSRRAADTALLFAAISVDELHAERLRGYGQVSDAGQILLETIMAELHSLIGKLQAYLAQSGNADLQLRIERLDEVRNDVKLIQDLGRIITSYGLVEYREALGTIVDRMETKAFEIGVFGRVSSGKSSLLNYLLGVDCLPVGVTPVTAVSTRISYGQHPQAGIEFVDHPPQIVSFSQLWEFATEQGNPSNAKHVTKIRIKFPASKLKEGITFVDTPGLGSLATSGSAEALAYLPRCDLGLLMIDASAGICLEDFAVVDALYRAGASAMILISKVDLYSQAERTQMIEYVKRQIHHELGVLPPVFPVSVYGESAVLCDDWFTAHLQPTLESHHQSANAATNRKAAVLRDAVIATLETRLTGVRQPESDKRQEKEKLVKAFAEVEKSF